MGQTDNKERKSTSAVFRSLGLDNFPFLCDIFWYFAIFFCNLFRSGEKCINMTIFHREVSISSGSNEKVFIPLHVYY